MNICIELKSHQNNGVVIKADIQKNIDVLDKYIDKASAHDSILLMDTRSILTGLQEQLVDGETWI